MSFAKVGRRLGHISTARLAARLEADTYETEHVNWTNIQSMIKTKYLFKYANPQKPTESYQCVAVRIRKPTLSFDRVAVIEAKRWYELVSAGLPPRWFTTANDDVTCRLQLPTGNGGTKGRNFPVIRAVMPKANNMAWYVAGWSPYCLLPSTFFERRPSRNTRHKLPHPDPQDLIKSHKIIKQSERGHSYIGATDINKFLVEPLKIDKSEFFTIKTRGC